jgi:glycosyltransferase involved in cell wall biosynthesis
MNARRSILHFSNSTLWGGVEEHICGLLRNLSRSLFRAQLVCDPVVYERFRAALPEDVEVNPLSLSSPKHVGAGARFAKLILREQFQIVHSHMFWSSLFASPIAWACRVPNIVETLHGTEAWRRGWKASFIVDRATTHFVSRYVAVSESDAHFLREKKKVSAQKITLIHNGIDTRRFLIHHDARTQIRTALGFTDGDVVLIAVARFHSGKGHRILLEAMSQLVLLDPGLKLICLGEGEEGSQLKALAESLQLTDFVRFVGYQRNVPEWLAAADINVLPTFYEGFPLTVLEAMAAGLPTVASNVGGIPEAVDNNLNGILIPLGDVNALVHAISTLVHDNQLRARMGRDARLRAMQRFDIEQQVRRTEKMYLEMSTLRGPQDERTPTAVPMKGNRLTRPFESGMRSDL